VTDLEVKRERGLTLVELIVALAVVAIVTALGVPSMKGVMEDYRSRSTMSDLVADLNLARVEAIKRNRRMVLCPRDAATLNPCDSVNGWNNGWVVCYMNDTGGCEVTTPDDPNPIRVTNPLNTDQLTLTGTLGSVTFTPVGASLAETVLTLKSGKVTRTATIALTGNVTSKKN
jgi:type IV fimbrial biogenesis protein FimT